jgi:predicted nucleotidyltransferase component of viral defense system
MFHLSTVEPDTLHVLEEIFSFPEIKRQFALAGGTSLALQIGHRMSVDLDLFSGTSFSTENLNKELNAGFHPEYELLGMNKSMLFTNIKKVKCDFIFEPAVTIKPHVFMKGVGLYRVEDICAMKMHTICGRGKKKDFFDIYALLQLFSWEEMLGWFKEKYGDSQYYYLWKSIQYFEDAEDDPDIVGFPPFSATWEQIKEEVSRKCV